MTNPQTIIESTSVDGVCQAIERSLLPQEHTVTDARYELPLGLIITPGYADMQTQHSLKS
jgi:hypothetical protein